MVAPSGLGLFAKRNFGKKGAMCPIFFSSSRRGPSPQAPCPYPLHHLPNIFPPNLPQTPQTPNQGFTMSGVLPTCLTDFFCKEGSQLIQCCILNAHDPGF